MGKVKIYKVEEIISDEEIEKVHAYADFGNRPKREVVNQALLKHACGFYQGFTSSQIIFEHGLVDKNPREGGANLTEKGRQYLYAAFENEHSV